MLRRNLISLLAIALLILAGSTFAMGIGTLKVLSNMGEPLRVRIAVSLDQDVLPGAECFALAGPSRFSTALSGARLELVKIDGKRYVNVIGRTPATAPIVDLSLRSEGCGPTLQKDFVVLLSPKDINAAEASQPAASATRPKSARPGASSSAGAAKAKRAKHPIARKTGRSKHRPHKAVSRANRPRHSEFVMKLDYSYEAFAKAAGQIDQERHAAHAVAPSHGDRLVLESTDLDQAAGAGVQGGAPQANGVSSQVGKGLVGGDATGPSSGGRAGLAGGPVIPERSSSGSLFSALLSPLNLVILALLLVIVLLVAWWFRSRIPQSAYPDSSTGDFRAARSGEDPVVFPGSRTSGSEPVAATETLAESAKAKSAPQDVVTPHHIPAPREANDKTLGLRLATIGDFSVEQYDSADHVIELAEVMMAFGRSNQAIETLTQHIRNNPNQSVEPWLKLLDLYKDTGSREEFEALAAELHKHFNVVIAEWGDFERSTEKLETGTLTLESLPHIMEQVTTSWGSAECMTYLDKLVTDNRGGQRQGFSLPLIRDVLLLKDVLRKTLNQAS